MRIRSTPPEARLLALCARGGDGDAPSRLYLRVEVIDAERDPVDLDLRVQSAGNALLLVGATGSGALGLRSDRAPAGVVHEVEWIGEAACEGDLGDPGCAGLCQTLRSAAGAQNVECRGAPTSGSGPFVLSATPSDTRDLGPTTTAELTINAACP